MKKLKGNISILVIFILLASSLIGVLTSSYVRELLAYSDNINKYYKSYYISKGGMELALAQINNRGIGFQYALSSGSSMKDNFLCSGVCYLSNNVNGLSSIISNSIDDVSGCNSPIVFFAGESMVVPLFTDAFEGSVYDSLVSPIVYRNLSFNLPNVEIKTNDLNKKINLGIVFMSGDEIFDQGFFFKSLLLNTTSIKDFVSSFEDYAKNVPVGNRPLSDDYKIEKNLKPNDLKPYLILSNPEEQGQINLCLIVKEQIQTKNKNFLPLPYYYTRNISAVSDFILGLDSKLKQPIPSFLANTYFGLE